MNWPAGPKPGIYCTLVIWVPFPEMRTERAFASLFVSVKGGAPAVRTWGARAGEFP